MATKIQKPKRFMFYPVDYHERVAKAKFEWNLDRLQRLYQERLARRAARHELNMKISGQVGVIRAKAIRAAAEFLQMANSL